MGRVRATCSPRTHSIQGAHSIRVSESPTRLGVNLIHLIQYDGRLCDQVSLVCGWVRSHVNPHPLPRRQRSRQGRHGGSVTPRSRIENGKCVKHRHTHLALLISHRLRVEPKTTSFSCRCRRETDVLRKGPRRAVGVHEPSLRAPVVPARS